MTEIERKIEAAIVDFCRIWNIAVDEGHICCETDCHLVSTQYLAEHIARELARK